MFSNLCSNSNFSCIIFTPKHIFTYECRFRHFAEWFDWNGIELNWMNSCTYRCLFLGCLLYLETYLLNNVIIFITILTLIYNIIIYCIKTRWLFSFESRYCLIQHTFAECVTHPPECYTRCLALLRAQSIQTSDSFKLLAWLLCISILT